MDIENWLRGLRLEQYQQAFRDNAIDGEILPKLTADDLKDMGVAIVGHRRKLLEAIAALSSKGPAAPTPPPASQVAPAAPRDAERRQMTMLFCDLVGSTELSSRLDPKDLRTLMRGYHDCCAGVVDRWHGHVAKFLGDGVLVYFGYPRMREDDAERAVRAGLALVQAVAQLEPRPDVRLQARIGIATGLAVVAVKVVDPGKPGQAVGCDTVSADREIPRMNVHKNARLTPQGRLLLVQRVTHQGWTVRSAAGAAGLSERQAYRWLARYRAGGTAALVDRSSAPQRCRHRVPAGSANLRHWAARFSRPPPATARSWPASAIPAWASLG